MWRCLAIVNEAEPACGRGTLIRRFRDAQVAGRVIKITMLHKNCARAFTPLSVSSNQRGEQFSAYQLSSLSIIGSDYALIIVFPRHYFLYFFGDLGNSLAAHNVGGAQRRG